MFYVICDSVSSSTAWIEAPVQELVFLGKKCSILGVLFFRHRGCLQRRKAFGGSAASQKEARRPRQSWSACDNGCGSGVRVRREPEEGCGRRRTVQGLVEESPSKDHQLQQEAEN